MITGNIGNEFTFITKDYDEDTKISTIIDLTGIDYYIIVLSIGNNRIERDSRVDLKCLYGDKTKGEIKYTIQSGDIPTSGELQIQVTLYFLDGDVNTCNVLRETVQSKL